MKMGRSFFLRNQENEEMFDYRVSKGGGPRGGGN